MKLQNGAVKDVPKVVKEIDDDKTAFYFTIGSKKAEVMTANNPGNDSGKHIKTNPDSTKDNNLLDLDRF